MQNDCQIGALWREPPGGILVWLIVLVELVTFGAVLAVLVVNGHEHKEIFQQGRELLNQSIGMINTIVLLTGGLFMANSMECLRTGNNRRAELWLEAAIGSGLLFLLLKGIEYADKLDHGFGLHANVFFTFYWLVTGFHFIHVLVAVVILTFMWRGIRSGVYTQTRHEDVRSSAVFWHMCDLIWLLIYPVIYLFH